MKWSKPAHLGFGRVEGEPEVEDVEFLEDITIVDEEEESDPFAELPTTLTSVNQGHYGNPHDGCLDDEDVIATSQGSSCMPTVSSQMDENGLPTPNCKIGGASPVENNGCPTDAVVPQGSKAFPICLAKGNTTDPYTNGEFHCVLVCPCANLDAEGQCSQESHAHCPSGATCQLGDLRHRGQGICSYGQSTSINV